MARLRNAQRLAVAIVFVAAATLGHRSAGAEDRQLQLARDDMGRLAIGLQELVATPVESFVHDRQRRFEQRLADAELLFLLEDFTRASMSLYDIVGDVANRSLAGYDRAVYYLAESLYQIEHNLSARDYFEQLVERRSAAHIANAVRRLIQLSDRQGSWAGVRNQVSVLEQMGPIPSDIAYIYAKSLLRQSAAAEAKRYAAMVPKDHILWGKAQYVAAVADVQLGDFAAARASFGALTEIDDSSEDAAEVRDLAALNEGRLFLEENDLVNAIDSYQNIRRNSPHFDRALYEVTWTFVRAANGSDDPKVQALEYQKAMRALEILLLDESERPLAPEARLLLGNILLRLGDFEDATSKFSEIVDRYGPVRQELHSLTADESDPKEYYREVVQRSQSSGTLLPELALKWAANEEELAKALDVVGDLNQGDEWLSDSNQLIKTLLDALNSPQKAAFFPQLQGVQTKAIEFRNTIISINKRLLAVERDALANTLSAEERGELDALLAERRELEPEYLALPQNQLQYESRAKVMRAELAELERVAHRMGLQLTSFRRQLLALYDEIKGSDADLTEEEQDSARAMVDVEAVAVKALEDRLAELRAEISRRRDLVTATTSSGKAEDQLRRAYERNLQREQELLSNASVRAAGNVGQLVEEVSAERLRLEQFHATLGAFQGRLDRVVNEKAKDVRAQVLREQGMLSALRSESESTRSVAQAVVGQVAVDSMNAVEGKFEQIILRADVGIVDVAWAKKEATTEKITEQVGAQRRAVEQFDAEYQEVLIDD